MNHKADDTRVLDMADMAQIGAFAFLLRQNTPHVEGDYARKFGDLTKLDKQSPTQDQIYQIILGSVSGPCWSVNTGPECGKRNARNHPQNHHYMGGTQTIPKWLGCYWVYHIRMFYGSKKCTTSWQLRSIIKVRFHSHLFRSRKASDIQPFMCDGAALARQTKVKYNGIRDIGCVSTEGKPSHGMVYHVFFQSVNTWP